MSVSIAKLCRLGTRLCRRSRTQKRKRFVCWRRRCVSTRPNLTISSRSIVARSKAYSTAFVNCERFVYESFQCVNYSFLRLCDLWFRLQNTWHSKYSSLSIEILNIFPLFTVWDDVLSGVATSCHDHRRVHSTGVRQSHRTTCTCSDNLNLHRYFSITSLVRILFSRARYMIANVLLFQVAWSEEMGDWQLKAIAYTGNNMRATRNPPPPPYEVKLSIWNI